MNDFADQFLNYDTLHHKKLRIIPEENAHLLVVLLPLIVLNPKIVLGGMSAS